MKSFFSTKKSIHVVKSVRDATAEGGFHLTQFVSNSKPVLESVPENERAKSIQAINLGG